MTPTDPTIVAIDTAGRFFTTFSAVRSIGWFATPLPLARPAHFANGGKTRAWQFVSKLTMSFGSMEHEAGVIAMINHVGRRGWMPA